MSKTPTKLSATSRTIVGKHVAHLRKEGQVPAVVFGHGMASIPIALNEHEFELLRRTVHSSTLVDLQIDGKEKHKVLVHGFQVDPRTRHLLHVDLFAIKSGEEVTVEVPLVSTGTAYAAEKLGGTLLHNVSHVRVRALPEHLPEQIEFSVESLVDFDVAVHLRDIAIPAGVTVLTDLDEIIAKVAPPHVAEEAPAAAEEAPVEGAAPAEGEAAKTE